LKVTVPPALTLFKMYHAEIVQADLHVFCAQRKIGLENNVANEGKIGR